MKLTRKLAGVLAIALVLSLCGVAFAQKVDVNSVPRVDPATDLDVSNSSHNLSRATGLHTVVTAGATIPTGTDEVCVFCHTPHFSNPDVVDAPLWNRMTSTASYTPYDSSTEDSKPGNPGGNSIACLSCHDGTIAYDSLVNAPGRGLGKSTTNVSNTSYTFSGNVATFNNDPLWSLMWNFVDRNGVAIASPAMMTGRVVIGQDLSNDHPISMPFPDPAIDPGFNVPTGYVVGSGGARVFPNGIRTFSGDKVECGSCHEPHWGSPQATAKGIIAKLRVSNTQSAVCLTCHIK